MNVQAVNAALLKMHSKASGSVALPTMLKTRKKQQKVVCKTKAERIKYEKMRAKNTASAKMNRERKRKEKKQRIERLGAALTKNKQLKETVSKLETAFLKLQSKISFVKLCDYAMEDCYKGMEDLVYNGEIDKSIFPDLSSPEKEAKGKKGKGDKGKGEEEKEGKKGAQQQGFLFSPMGIRLDMSPFIDQSSNNGEEGLKGSCSLNSATSSTISKMGEEGLNGPEMLLEDAWLISLGCSSDGMDVYNWT